MRWTSKRCAKFRITWLLITVKLFTRFYSSPPARSLTKLIRIDWQKIMKTFESVTTCTSRLTFTFIMQEEMLMKVNLPDGGDICSGGLECSNFTNCVSVMSLPSHPACRPSYLTIGDVMVSDAVTWSMLLHFCYKTCNIRSWCFTQIIYYVEIQCSIPAVCAFCVERIACCGVWVDCYVWVILKRQQILFIESIYRTSESESHNSSPAQRCDLTGYFKPLCCTKAKRKGTFKYHMTLREEACSNRQNTSYGGGDWPNRHITFIVAKKA